MTLQTYDLTAGYSLLSLAVLVGTLNIAFFGEAFVGRVVAAAIGAVALWLLLPPNTDNPFHPAWI